MPHHANTIKYYLFSARLPREKSVGMQNIFDDITVDLFCSSSSAAEQRNAAESSASRRGAGKLDAARRPRLARRSFPLNKFVDTVEACHWTDSPLTSALLCDVLRSLSPRLLPIQNTNYPNWQLFFLKITQIYCK